MISISSRLGDSPDASSAARIASTTLPRRNWIGDRLTATCTGFGHLVHSAQALRSTQLPISTMRPISSAIGMNSAGETMPRSGCGQRNSASQVEIRLVRKLKSGW